MITENYIKMCEQAGEIQREWKPKDGDYFYGYEWGDLAYYHRQTIIKDKNEISEFAKKEIHLLYFTGDDYDACFPIGENIGYDNPKPDLTKSFWLPTQEQLQEMIKDKWICEADMLFVFKYWIEKAMVEKIISVAKYTLTELWLAFVMHEKYNKIWTGEKWEKE